MAFGRSDYISFFSSSGEQVGAEAAFLLLFQDRMLKLTAFFISLFFVDLDPGKDKSGGQDLFESREKRRSSSKSPNETGYLS